MSALAELKNLPYRKSEQASYVAVAVAEILDGNIDPLQADLRLKAMFDVIKAIRENDKVKEYVLEEASKYGKNIETDAYTVTLSQRTEKDYTGIDSVLDGLYLTLEQTKAQIKAREATLAAGCDPATGETFAPPKTKTTQFLTYKFK